MTDVLKISFAFYSTIIYPNVVKFHMKLPYANIAFIL